MLANRSILGGNGWFLLLAPVLLLSVPGRSTARDPLRVEIKKASEKLRDYFSGRRIKEVSVGDVTCADDKRPISSGPGLRLLLIEELQRTELKVRPRAGVSLAVSYRSRKVPLKNDRKVERIVVDLRFTATFSRDNSQEDILSFRIANDEATRHVLGLTVYNRARGKARETETVLAFDKPTANLDGAVALAGEKSPFGMEILVGDKALTPLDKGGFGQVSIDRDQTYVIRLINRSSIEVAVRLSVDGLNVFTFSDLRQKEGPYKGSPLYDMVLIPAKDSILIKGWHKDNSTSSKFKITQYADTAAAKMGRTNDMGTVAATFCAAWTKTPPEDEPDGARAPGDDGTGFGEPTAAKFVPVQRTIGAVRASVALRYQVPMKGK